jgi:hypothetical protein
VLALSGTEHVARTTCRTAVGDHHHQEMEEVPASLPHATAGLLRSDGIDCDPTHADGTAEGLLQYLIRQAELVGDR